MKLKTTLFCFVFTSFMYAQTTALPDANFEQALIDLDIDTNGSTGDILNSDAAGITDLQLTYKSISSLNGIGAFVDLEILNAGYNNLNSINVSSLQKLEELFLPLNNLSSINLSSNSALEQLNLSENRIQSFSGNGLPNLEYLTIADGKTNFKLSSINVQNNPLLISLSVQGNVLTSIDISNNNALTLLQIYQNTIQGTLDVSHINNINLVQADNNNLETVNVANGNNSQLAIVYLTSNPNLTCIQVDDVAYANSQSLWTKDATASYSTACSTLGIEEQVLASSFKIYPNPVTNILNIESTEPITDLQLTNINGQVVFKTKNQLNQIDVSSFNAGLYFLKVETKKGVITRKVVKL